MHRKSTLILIAFATATTLASHAHADWYGYGGPVGRPYIQHQSPIGVGPLVTPQLPSAPAGSTLTLPANFLGPAPGSVFMVFKDIKLPVQIVNWSNESITVTLPPMAIRHDVRIRLDVILPHGQVGLQKLLVVTPPADVVLHPTAPQSPLPTNAALQAAGLLGEDGN